MNDQIHHYQMKYQIMFVGVVVLRELVDGAFSQVQWSQIP